MSAVNAFVQKKRRAVHLMTDGLSYIDGVPFEVDCHKAHLIDGMRAVLASTGPSLLGPQLAELLYGEFSSFDALIENGTPLMKETFLNFANDHRDGDAVAVIVIAGWHEAANRPALYSMMMRTDGEKWQWIKKHGQSGGSADPNFEFIEQEVIGYPCPTMEQFRAASYDLLGDFDDKNPEIELLHQLEIQRRILIDGRHYVGGQALLTSIDESGCTQCIVHRWEEDQAELPIQPKPIDWKAWRAKRVLAAAGIVPEQLSRLQRARLEKKALKGTLRVV
jgi:hypothetical protein